MIALFGFGIWTSLQYIFKLFCLTTSLPWFEPILVIDFAVIFSVVCHQNYTALYIVFVN